MKSSEEIIEASTKWSTIWWACKTFFLPLTIPLIVLRLWNHLKERKYRDSLPGKMVVITGASSGLGEALAHVFYNAGCKLILIARRKEELERVRRDLIQEYSKEVTYPPVCIPLDIADLDAISEKAKSILLTSCNEIDILVNCAGISVRAPIEETKLETHQRLMMVNYFGQVALTRALLPSMIQRQEGRIVFISSVQGKFSIPHRSAYSASKHALQAFADCLRAELTQHNIKVTLVSPGYISTNLSKNAITGDGTPYGKMDETTAKGERPETMARRVLLAVLRDKSDVVEAPLQARAAYWLRFLCPTLYFWIMARRAVKLDQKDHFES